MNITKSPNYYNNVADFFIEVFYKSLFMFYISLTKYTTRVIIKVHSVNVLFIVLPELINYYLTFMHGNIMYMLIASVIYTFPLTSGS